MPFEKLDLLEVRMRLDLVDRWLDLGAAETIRQCTAISDCEVPGGETYTSNRASILSLVKLLMPIVLTLPFSTSFSIAAHVSATGMSAIWISPVSGSVGNGLSELGNATGQ